jgi:hypothetical protein
VLKILQTGVCSLSTLQTISYTMNLISVVKPAEALAGESRSDVLNTLQRGKSVRTHCLERGQVGGTLTRTYTSGRNFTDVGNAAGDKFGLSPPRRAFTQRQCNLS